MTEKRMSAAYLVPLAWILVLDVVVALAQKMASVSANGDGIDFYLSMAQMPWFWICILLPTMQLFLWTKLLSKMELSLAMPLTSLCYPCTMIAAHWVFHEHYSRQAWIGAFLIMIGVGLLGTQGRSSDDMT